MDTIHTLKMAYDYIAKMPLSTFGQRYHIDEYRAESDTLNALSAAIAEAEQVENKNPCDHKCTHYAAKPTEDGNTIEICDGCGMSRSHWEQGASPWMQVVLCDLCGRPAVDKAGEIPSPLTVDVADGQLVIRLGVNTLADAFEGSQYNTPFDAAVNDYIKKFKVDSAPVFAKEVVRALTREAEDGATLLTRLLDDATEDAVEDGAEGISECGERFDLLKRKRHQPLNMPADRSKNIERAVNADDGCISAGEIPSDSISKSERKRQNVLQGKPMMEGVSTAPVRRVMDLAKLRDRLLDKGRDGVSQEAIFSLIAELESTRQKLADAQAVAKRWEDYISRMEGAK